MRVPRVIVWLVVAASLSGCAGCPYSFTGASVPPHLKTIAIPIVEDQSGFGEATLRDQFSQQLLQRFVNDATLQPSDRSNADSMLEGVITSVKDVPVVVEGGDQVSKRRVTITAHITFRDLKLKKKMWEKDFSQWGDYQSGGGLTQRNGGVTEALRKITEDILNETVAGW
ncbi:MAG TPA: LptE family protein [Bacteroidota bacterium]|nr:LptE family protein [Bacteroidota bacterium]